MSIIQSTRDEIMHQHRDAHPDTLQRAMEHAAIHTSLANLEDFPFVKEQIAANKLQLHGGFFDIASGELYSLDHSDNEFKPV